MNTLIRPFQPADRDDVIALWQASGLTRPWNDPGKDIDRKCSVQDDLFLIAQADQVLVGSVMGGYDGHRGWINYLAVLPDWRRQGLGRLLMGEVETRLLASGCPKINLQIRLGNEQALAFYESLGFTDDQCYCLGKRLISDE